MQFRVYGWRHRRSVAPEIVQEVQASNAEAAIALVMQACQVRFLHCVWVVSDEDEQLSENWFHVSRLQVHRSLDVGGRYREGRDEAGR